MESKLYEAAMTGNVIELHALLGKDFDVLVQALRDYSSKNNPLHIGARFGHLDFVKEILKIKREYARELNSQGQSPLHLASAKGHVEVVKELLRIDSNVCFIHDRDGRTPLHLAAMKGRVEVLKELVFAKPKAAWTLTDQGEPILHLCVKHDQFDAMKMLIELALDSEFVTLKDDDDNTIFHLLVAKEQYKVIKYLVSNNNYTGGDVDMNMNMNAINVDGWTALDVARNSISGSNRWKIRGLLKSAGAKTAKQISPTLTRKTVRKVQRHKSQEWLSKMKDSLLVVAALLATVTFQIGMNPPGGVYQEDDKPNDPVEVNAPSPSSSSKTPHHLAGQAIMSFRNAYKYFTFFNVIGLLASLSLILLLVSGLSFQRKISVRGLMFITWIAVGSLLVTYWISFVILTPNIWGWELHMFIALAIVLWLVLMCLVLGTHVFRCARRIFHTVGILHYFGRFFRSFSKKVCRLANNYTMLSNARNAAAVERRGDPIP